MMSPFGGFKDFDDCLAKTRRTHPDWSRERCERYCGAIKHQTEGSSRSARRRQQRR